MPGENPARGGAVSSAGEEALIRCAVELGAARAGHAAMHFHLSRLKRVLRGAKHLRIAARLLKEVLEPHPFRLFVLRRGDLMVMAKDLAQETIDTAIETLRYLYNGDPLVQAGRSAAEFCTIYTLEHDYLQFLAAVYQGCAADAARTETARPQSPAPQQRPGNSLDSGRLGEFIKTIGRIDLANMVRQQTVWHFPEGGTPEPVFDELFISIKAICEALAPGSEIDRDPQILQIVTRWFDRYMLTNLCRDFSRGTRPRSININMATLLSPDFLKFETQRPSNWHGQIILETQLPDLWQDLPTYVSVTQAVKQRGFACCLDGVQHFTLPFVNLGRLDVDYVKLIWNDALLQLDEAGLRDFCRALRDCGAARIILTRCGSEEAVRFGQAAQIGLFQGYYLDRLAREKTHSSDAIAAAPTPQPKRRAAGARQTPNLL